MGGRGGTLATGLTGFVLGTTGPTGGVVGSELVPDPPPAVGGGVTAGDGETCVGGGVTGGDSAVFVVEPEPFALGTTGVTGGALGAAGGGVGLPVFETGGRGGVDVPAPGTGGTDG